MRPEKPKRIEVNPEQGGLASVGQALNGLNLGPLPPPPPAAAPPAVPQAVTPAKKRRLGRVVLRKETAHRGGRVVIVLYDFPPTVTPSELETLAKELRQSLGTGGTVKDRTIEMQGNHPEKIRAFLISAGYDVAGI